MDLKASAVVAVRVAIPCLTLLAGLSPSLIHAQTLARVDITLDGKVVTDQTPVNPKPVLVGQPIHLGFAVSGGTVTSFKWLLPWGVVSYSNPTPQTEKITTLSDCAACYTQVSPTLYWIDQGSKTVTLYYVVNAGGTISSGRASATFITQGPKNVVVSALYNVNGAIGQGSTTGKVALYNSGGQSWVGLGDGTAANEGITFKVTSATMPSSAAGQFQWVQLINSDTIQYFTPSGVTCNEQATGGLDLPSGATNYWYGLGLGPIDDSVTQELGSGSIFNRVNRRFTAFMYLRWKAYSNYIPVPIGYVAWYTGWNLTYGKKTDGTLGWMAWWYDAGASPLEPSLVYPTWTRTSTIPPQCKW